MGRHFPVQTHVGAALKVWTNAKSIATYDGHVTPQLAPDDRLATFDASGGACNCDTIFGRLS